MWKIKMLILMRLFETRGQTLKVDHWKLSDLSSIYKITNHPELTAVLGAFYEHSINELEL